MGIHKLAPPSLAIHGSADRFPVRRILCVGQNYAAHAREMGGDPMRTPPFFFDKPGDAVVESGATIPYPPATAQLEHEVELVVAIGSGGAIWGHAVGLDLTRRDLQHGYKRDAKPWDMARRSTGARRSARWSAAARRRRARSAAPSTARCGRTGGSRT